jgi:hypothetical protein
MSTALDTIAPAFSTQVRAALTRRGFKLDGPETGTLVVAPTLSGAQVKPIATYASVLELQRTGQIVLEALEADGFDVVRGQMGETTVYSPKAPTEAAQPIWL